MRSQFKKIKARWRSCFALLTVGALPPPQKRKWSHLVSMDSYLSYKRSLQRQPDYNCEQRLVLIWVAAVFLAASWLHLIRGRVRSLKCVVRAPSCQTFWRVRLIAHRLPGLFVWYISNKPREAYHFSSSPLLVTVIYFLNENTCTAWRKTSQMCLSQIIPEGLWNKTLQVIALQ